MRAATRADVFSTGQIGLAVASWPVAFLVSVVVLLGSVVYLCAVVADVIAPPARAAANPVAAGAPLPQVAVSEDDIRESQPALGMADTPALDAAIRDALARHEESAGVAVFRMDDGRRAGHNADRVFYAASTFKLAVLYEVERRVSAGELAYEDRIVLTDGAVAEDLGTLELVPVAADGTVSIGGALEAMVTLSDNATAVALMRLVSPAAIDDTLRELGLATMSVNTTDLPATANDLALLMRAILQGTGVAPAQREHMHDLLTRQSVRDGIPSAAGRGAGVRVGNKTGTWPGITNDVAFVETGQGAYVIAVMAEGDWNWDLIRDVSAAVDSVMAGR
ncbi:MAG TPA: class A beta-lactamase-related serine hydrolase [Tepidiformaceae bacterium]|nr:class A beta-lactamase-related serine hydrolase [Tepidiformaceae bacterium]